MFKMIHRFDSGAVYTFIIYFFFKFWLCWVFTVAWAVLQLQRVVATLQLQRAGFSLLQLLLLQSRDSVACCRIGALGHAGISNCGSWAQQLWLPGSRAQTPQVRHTGLGHSTACGTFLDQGSNSCLLHWQPDSLPLSHQGSPRFYMLLTKDRLNDRLFMQLFLFSH